MYSLKQERKGWVEEVAGDEALPLDPSWACVLHEDVHDPSAWIPLLLITLGP